VPRPVLRGAVPGGGDTDVRCYLDHSPKEADRWTFADVLAGRYDAEVMNPFGDASAEGLKAAVRRRGG
jgi:hypothetical protein